MKKKKKQPSLEYEQLTLDGFRIAKGYYTTREVAELYHVTTNTVVSWVHKGWLPASRNDGPKKAGNWRIHPQAIEDIDRAIPELIRSYRGLLVRAYGWRKKRA